MDFTPFRFKDGNSHLVLLNIGIRTLSFQVLKFVSYAFETLEFAPDPFIICVWILSLQKLEFALYPFKHWNLRLILSKIGMSCPYKHWNSHLILLNTGIRTLSFWTSEVASYPLKHWNSHLILLGKVIPTFSF